MKISEGGRGGGLAHEPNLSVRPRRGHPSDSTCAAYVASQASEGWTLLPDEYDDGGISGGTLDRPALQQLLADIAAGLIDIVVVYKVDRLTRSLLDFAKLVEAFDQAGVSFVSITQSFNTTTSMGRLTLNMLLSFAQFEREVTAERIRDKLAASKAKGMCMGGVPPLGYRADGRSLAIVEKHAGIVRDIYARYARLGNVRLVADQLHAEGIHVPKRTSGTGRAFGGKPFTRGQLYQILKSAIYVGDIPHREKTYPGNHPALIERVEWEAVQRKLASHVQGGPRSRTGAASPLAGKMFDGAGEPLIATHTTKNGKERYRYYVSKALHTKTGEDGMRLPAQEVEQAAALALAGLFLDPLKLAELAGIAVKPHGLLAMVAKANAVAEELRAESANAARFLDRLEVQEAGISLIISTAAVIAALELPTNPESPPSFTHLCPVRLTRTGRALRLIHGDGALVTGSNGVDLTLLRLLGRAQEWWKLLRNGQFDPTGLAEREGITVSYIVRVVRLAFLSPRVVEGILAGKLRPGVDGAACPPSAPMAQI
jgi:site-specific DNA recombinase